MAKSLLSGQLNLLGCAASSIQISLTQGSSLLSVSCNEFLEVIWNSCVFEDGLNWTLGLTGTTMNALIRVNHEHAHVIPFCSPTVLIVVLLFLDVIETIDRANLYARTILCAQTVKSNDVSHEFQSVKKTITVRMLHNLTVIKKGMGCGWENVFGDKKWVVPTTKDHPCRKDAVLSLE
jgi:hypothetical protein